MNVETIFNQFVIGFCFGNGFVVATFILRKLFDMGVCP
jgi:hypothetical protein